LIKLAAKYGAEALLPPSRKSTEFKETRRAERGLAIKGTGVGQKVKGHKWERTMESRLEDRRKAMEGMPELVRLWKQVRITPDSDTLIGLMLISLNREATDVAGSNGPSGKLQHRPPQPMFFSFLSWSVEPGFLNAYRDLFLQHIITETCKIHSRSLGWSFVFEVYYPHHLYNITYNLKA
jgi:large subunit ribosomal protein L25